MAITLQILEQRLTAIEREIVELKAQLARSPNVATQDARGQHAAAITACEAARERLGIHGQPIGAKEFRQRLVAGGMNPDDNAFSREIIAMREE